MRYKLSAPSHFAYHYPAPGFQKYQQPGFDITRFSPRAYRAKQFERLR